MTSNLKNKPTLSKETLDSVMKVFKLFQETNGTMNCDALMNALRDLKFDLQDPAIFDIIEEICTTNKVGLTYDKFVEKLNEQLQDRESQKSLERTYELFVDEPQGILTMDILQRVQKEAGDNASEEELKNTFNNASSNGRQIPFDEFQALMTKKNAK